MATNGKRKREIQDENQDLGTLTSKVPSIKVQKRRKIVEELNDLIAKDSVLHDRKNGNTLRRSPRLSWKMGRPKTPSRQKRAPSTPPRKAAIRKPNQLANILPNRIVLQSAGTQPLPPTSATNLPVLSILSNTQSLPKDASNSKKNSNNSNSSLEAYSFDDVKTTAAPNGFNFGDNSKTPGKLFNFGARSNILRRSKRSKSSSTLPPKTPTQSRRKSLGGLTNNKTFKRLSSQASLDTNQDDTSNTLSKTPKTPGESHAFKRSNSGRSISSKAAKPIVTLRGSLRSKMASTLRKSMMKGQQDYSLPDMQGQLAYVQFLTAQQEKDGNQDQEDIEEDQELQQKIDYEIKMRDGTAKLLAASKHPHQLLEAAKNLLTSNTRMISYMSELQKRKTDEVMKRQDQDGNQVPCKGRLCISDLRVPLMWKDSDHFKNKGDHRRYAVFCMWRVGTEIFDTSLIKDVDRSMTDLTFEENIVFNNVKTDFECKLEVYCHKIHDDLTIASTPKRIKKKFNDFSNSVGRSVGRRLSGLREDPDVMGNMLVGPKYDLIAKGTLTLKDVDDYIGTYDLTVEPSHDSANDIPLFGNFCCKVAAQPHCLTSDTCSGYLLVKNSSTDWIRKWGVLRNLKLSCWESEEDRNNGMSETFNIPVTKYTEVSEAARATTNKPFTFQLSSVSTTEHICYQLSAESVEEFSKWWNGLQQHMLDQALWQHACDKLMEFPTGLSNHVPAYKRASGTIFDRTPSRNSTVRSYHAVPDAADSPMTRILNRLNIEEEEEELAYCGKRKYRPRADEIFLKQSDFLPAAKGPENTPNQSSDNATVTSSDTCTTPSKDISTKSGEDSPTQEQKVVSDKDDMSLSSVDSTKGSRSNSVTSLPEDSKVAQKTGENSLSCEEDVVLAETSSSVSDSQEKPVSVPETEVPVSVSMAQDVSKEEEKERNVELEEDQVNSPPSSSSEIIQSSEISPEEGDKSNVCVTPLKKLAEEVVTESKQGPIACELNVDASAGEAEKECSGIKVEEVEISEIETEPVESPQVEPEITSLAPTVAEEELKTCDVAATKEKSDEINSHDEVKLTSDDCENMETQDIVEKQQESDEKTERPPSVETEVVSHQSMDEDQEAVKTEESDKHCDEDVTNSIPGDETLESESQKKVLLPTEDVNMTSEADSHVEDQPMFGSLASVDSGINKDFDMPAQDQDSSFAKAMQNVYTSEDVNNDSAIESCGNSSSLEMEKKTDRGDSSFVKAMENAFDDLCHKDNTETEQESEKEGEENKKETEV